MSPRFQNANNTFGVSFLRIVFVLAVVAILSPFVLGFVYLMVQYKICVALLSLGVFVLFVVSAAKVLPDRICAFYLVRELNQRGYRGVKFGYAYELWTRFGSVAYRLPPRDQVEVISGFRSTARQDLTQFLVLLEKSRENFEQFMRDERKSADPAPSEKDTDHD